MRLRISLAVTLLTVFLTSIPVGAVTSREYPYFYKSPRAMGMGGAYVAIGGRTDTLFYNPAGLGTMPLEAGWEVNILGLTGEIGSNVLDFTEDLGDAFDTEDLDGDGDTDDDRLRAVNDVLADYRGKNLHLRVADLTSIGKNFGVLSFGAAGLGSARLDAVTHQGFGENGFLEINADALYGGIGGASYTISDGLYAGASLKYFYKEALVRTFTAREIVENEDNLDNYITDEFIRSGNGVGLDAGVLYQFARESRVRPAVGLSLLNIGDIDFNDAGAMPMSVNVGVSVSPAIPLFEALTIGLDYVDVLNNYDQDGDAGKRLRFGGELGLFDSWYAAAALRAGLYQGYPTFGADIRLLAATLSYVTYAEEIGAYAGQDKDRRHIVMLNIGW